MSTTTARADLYTRITADIVAQLERGVRPWHQPWAHGHPAGPISRPLRSTGEPYRGINVVVLWLTAFEKGYSAPLWLTFQQAKQLGGGVKKGEKGTTVVYANTFEKTTTDRDSGEETTERIPFLKAYTVFNAEQTEGLPGHFYAPAAAPRPEVERLAHADAFFGHTKADTRHGGGKAFYLPAGDFIQLPPFGSFHTRETYYATHAHESIHWTKHENRLNRSFDSKRFGDAGYAVEELVAEMGAAFLCADLGITPEVMPEHAQYLNAWLTVLKQDAKAVFTAAAHAEKAAEYLHRLQPPALTADQPAPEPAPIDLEASDTFRQMWEAMERGDFLAVRELAEQLQRHADLSRRPDGVGADTLTDRIRTARARSIYPD
jgi:antirestriction protein ArdC